MNKQLVTLIVFVDYKQQCRIFFVTCTLWLYYCYATGLHSFKLTAIWKQTYARSNFHHHAIWHGWDNSKSI